MSEFEMRRTMRKMKREELMMLLASYLLQEQGVEVTNEKQLAEMIEQNYMGEVAREDLMVEILNSRERLGIV
jgi:vacuolar-type H+-ATPase subunit D/Vma8